MSSKSPVWAYSLPASLLLIAPFDILASLAMDIYLPIVPAMPGILETSPDVIQLTLSLYMLTLGLGQLIFGPISDSIGRRPVLIGGASLFAAASFGLAASSTATTFLAFRLLQAEGLVNLAEGRGIVVRGMEVQDFLEIYEIRAALDGVVARNATVNRSPEFLKRLQENIEISEFLLARERWEDLQEEFRKFHTLLQDACGNARLRDLLSNLQDYSSASSEFTRPTPEHAPSTYADHVRLYDAIKSGDPEAAAKAAIIHVENERAELLQATATST